MKELGNAKQAAMVAMSAPGAMDAPTVQDTDTVKMLAEMNSKLDQMMSMMQGGKAPMGGM